MLRFIFWLFLAAVLALPIPYGGIFPWAYVLFAIAMGILTAAWAVALAIRGETAPVAPRRIWIPALLYFAVIVWAGVQAAQWTPDAWHAPIWQEAGRILGRSLPGRISVDPTAVNAVAVRLLSYAAVFWLALQYGRSDRDARRIFYAVAIVGTVYATYGLVVEFTGSESILWFEKERYRDNLTSTFRYKNSYAGFAGLTLIATLTVFAEAIGRENFAALGPRERLRTAIALAFGRISYVLVGFILILSALMLADSRGGFLATLIGIAVFVGAIAFLSPRKLTYRWHILGALFAVGAIFVSVSGGNVLDRIAGTTTSEERVSIYEGTLRAIAERPLLGWGAGSFEGVFGLHQGPGFRTRPLRAHNEYLDSALEYGIPAAAALAISVAWLGAVCARGVRRRRRNNFYPAAGLASVVLVGFHAGVDFTLQDPGVPALFALLAGTGCAQSWNSDRRRKGSHGES